MALNPFAESGKAQRYKTNLQGIDPNLRYQTQARDKARKEAADRLAKKQQDKDLELKYKPEEAWDRDALKFANEADVVLESAAKSRAEGTYSLEQKYKHDRELSDINSRAKLTRQQEGRYAKAKALTTAAKPGVFKDDATEMIDVYADPMSEPKYAKEIKEQYGGSTELWRAQNTHLLDLEKLSKPVNANEYAKRFTGALKASDVEKGKITTKVLSANKPKIKEQVQSELDASAKYSDTQILFRQWKANQEEEGLPSSKEDFVDDMTDLVYNRQKTKYGYSEDEDTSSGYGSRKEGTYYTPIGRTLVSMGQSKRGSSSKILEDAVATEVGNKPLRAVSSNVLTVVGTDKGLSAAVGSQNVGFTPQKTGYPHIVTKKFTYKDESGKMVDAIIGSPLADKAEEYLFNNQMKGYTEKSRQPYTFGTVKIAKTGKETKTPLVKKDIDGESQFTIDDEVFTIDTQEMTATSEGGGTYEIVKEDDTISILNFDDTGTGKVFSVYTPTNKIKGEMKGRFGQEFIDEVYPQGEEPKKEEKKAKKIIKWD